MEIVCCIKSVPDTATQIKIDPHERRIQQEGVQYIVSPYDEFAVEEGLRIKEKLGGTVTVVTMGPERAAEQMRHCFAMGADKGIHLKDEAFTHSDTVATAIALAAAIRTLPQFDLILCGKHAVDGDTGQMGPMLAEFLRIPHVSLVMKQKIDPEKKVALVNRQVDGGEEVVRCPLPALWTCQKGLNEPRYPTLKGIMGAKKKEIQVLTAAGLGLSPGSVGLSGSKTEVIRLTLPPKRPPGRIIEGDEETAAKELVRLLREEAKVV